MKKRNSRGRLGRMMVAVALGGTAFQLSGCDPAVRDTLLTGLESTTSSLSNALISAFFISLQNDTASTEPLTTT